MEFLTSKLIKRTRMRTKILMSTIIVLVTFMVIFLHQSLRLQQQFAISQLALFSNHLLDNAYSTVRSSMVVGQSGIIKDQLKDIKENMGGVRVYITDFSKEIAYATESEKVRTSIDALMTGKDVQKALDELLATGVAPDRSYPGQIDGQPFISTLKPIFNNQACQHCHGSSRRILGAMVINHPAREVLAAVAQTRNKNILYFSVSLLCLVLVINWIFSKLVTSRLRMLEQKASQVAAGDIDVEVHDDYVDSIGRLSRNFHQMAINIRDRMEYANSLRLGISEPFYIVDPDLKITYINDAAAIRIAGLSQREAMGRKCYEVFSNETCEQLIEALKQAIGPEDAVAGKRCTLINRQGKEIPLLCSSSLLRDSRGNILGGFSFLRDLTAEVTAEKKLQESYFNEESAKKAMESKVNELSEIFGKVAQGDFTPRGALDGKNDAMDLLTQRLNQTLDGIVDLITQTKEHILPVIRGVIQISQGNQSLAQRTQQQAAAMEEISSTLEQLVSNTSQNLGNTRHADSMAKEAVQVAQDGGKQVEKTVRAMAEMSEASHKIVEMMELINEITFQTNLLSINAAVEAARAGEQGKGFAVVANEVRNLSKRSSAAAKDIQVLVREILDKVTKSSQWVEQLQANFEKIVKTSEGVSHALSEVTLGTEESAMGIEQISQGTTKELCEVNEKNAYFVDEIAEETQHLREKAEQLKNITDIFVLGNKDRTFPNMVKHESPKTSFMTQKERRVSAPVNHPLEKDLIRKPQIREVQSDLLAKDLDEGFEEY